MKNRFNGRLLFIDTETGGTDPTKHSLLSIGLVAWDVNRGIIDKKEIFINHDKYIVTVTAQNINKFELSNHKKLALPQKQVITELEEFLRKNFSDEHKTIIAGHNVTFDTNFIKYFLKQNGRSYEKLFSHRTIDTASIIQFLHISGKIQLEISSSSEAFKHFGIKPYFRHGALSDSIATAELFEEMLKLI